MGSLGLLMNALVLGATIKIMDNATEPLREGKHFKENEEVLGLFR